MSENSSTKLKPNAYTHMGIPIPVNNVTQTSTSDFMKFTNTKTEHFNYFQFLYNLNDK